MHQLRRIGRALVEAVVLFAFFAGLGLILVVLTEATR